MKQLLHIYIYLLFLSIFLKYLGETPLHTACKSGNVSRVSALLASPNVSINAKDNYGWTPLHEAVSNGRIECVKKLLSHKQTTLESFFSSPKNREYNLWLDY
jgi:ankyrin repeat protein